jgi:hypothetical protein
MNDAATKGVKATRLFDAPAMAELRNALEQARQQAGDDAAVAKRIDFLELGLRWTDVEARAHAFMEATTPDKTAAKKVLDERFALMRDLFQRAPLALNVAYISWGEDGIWSRLGWHPPKAK